MLDPRPVSMVLLRRLNGALQGQQSSIPTGQEVFVGHRSGPADIGLDDDLVSRLHVALYLNPSDGSLLLRDVGSTNGTLVNGARVRQCLLGHGDVLLIGATLLKVEAIAHPEPQLTPPAGVTRSVRSQDASRMTQERLPVQRRGTRSVLSGRLDDIQLPELIQLINSIRASGALQLRTAEHVGRIFTEEGELRGAEIEGSGLRGAPAFKAMVFWDSGSFELRPQDLPAIDVPITTPALMLVMEAFESGATCAHAPEPPSVLAPDGLEHGDWGGAELLPGEDEFAIPALHPDVVSQVEVGEAEVHEESRVEEHDDTGHVEEHDDTSQAEAREDTGQVEARAEAREDTGQVEAGEEGQAQAREEVGQVDAREAGQVEASEGGDQDEASSPVQSESTESFDKPDASPPTVTEDLVLRSQLAEFYQSMSPYALGIWAAPRASAGPPNPLVNGSSAFDIDVPLPTFSAPTLVLRDGEAWCFLQDHQIDLCVCLPATRIGMAAAQLSK